MTLLRWTTVALSCAAAVALVFVLRSAPCNGSGRAPEHVAAAPADADAPVGAPLAQRGFELHGSAAVLAPNDANDAIDAVQAIEGRVLDEAGAPLERVLIEGGPQDGRDARLQRLGSTDGDGRFRLEWPQTHPAVLQFSADDHATAVRAGVRSGDRLDVVLSSGVALTCEVSDVDSGAPLGGVCVVVGAGGLGPDAVTGWTDDAGRFATRVRAGTIQVRATLSGYVDGSAFVEVAAGTPRNVLLPLRPNASAFPPVWLAVFDATSGEPVERISVRSATAERIGTGLHRVAATAFPSSTSIEVGAAGYLWRHVSFTPPAGSDAQHAIRVRLERAATLAGCVIDESGAGVPRLRLRIATQGAGATAPYHRSWTERLVETDAAGCFEAVELAGGAAYVIESAGPSAALQVESPPLVAGRRTEVGDVTARTRAEPLRGIVRTAAGDLVDAARVEWAAASGARRLVTRSTSDGTFWLSTLLEAGWLVVRAPGFLPAVRAVAQDENGVELLAPPGFVITGRVLTVDGSSAVDARVTCIPAVPRDVPREVNALFPELAETIVHAGPDGRFVCEALGNGAHELWASRDGWQSPSVTVTPGNGPVTLSLEEGAAVIGTVVRAADGAPVPAFALRIRSERGWSGQDVVNGAGSFRARFRPGMEGSIRVTAPGYRPCEVTGIVLAPGETRHLLFPLDGAVRIDGVVRWEDGAPAAAIVLEHEGAVWTPRRVTTDAFGRFTAQLAGEPADVRLAAFLLDDADLLAEVRVPIVVDPAMVPAGALGSGGLELTARRPGIAFAGALAIEGAGADRIEGSIVELTPLDAVGVAEPVLCRVVDNAFRHPAVAPGLHRVLVRVELVRDGMRIVERLVPEPPIVTVPGPSDEPVSLRVIVD